MTAAPDRVEQRPQSAGVPQSDGLGPGGALVALPRAWRWRGSRLEAVWLAYRFPILVYVGTRLLLIALALVESQVRHHAFTGELSNWDGLWYRALAATGYPHHVSHFQTTLGFLPGYALLMWPLGHALVLLGLIPSNSILTAMSVAGIIISGIGGLVATVLISKLTEGWWGRSAARRAVVLFCLFPGSVVFSMVYSEGVMLPLAIGCILALERRRWLLAGILAGCATTMEPDAFVLVAVCAVSALLELRRRGWRDRIAWRSLLAPVLSATGVVAVGAFFWAWTGTPLASYHAQHYGWKEKTDVLALVHLTQNLFGQISFSHFDNPPINMNLVVGLLGAILLVVLLVLLARSWRTVSIEALVWTAGISFLAVTSEYVPPNPRLLITAFPAVLVLARYIKGKAFGLLCTANGALLLGMSWWTFVGVGLRP